MYDNSINPINYKKGNVILIKSETSNKQSEVYGGPYEMIKDTVPNVRILKNGKEIVVHKNRTKLYTRDSN